MQEGKNAKQTQPLLPHALPPTCRNAKRTAMAVPARERHENGLCQPYRIFPAIFRGTPRLYRHSPTPTCKNAKRTAMAAPAREGVENGCASPTGYFPVFSEELPSHPAAAVVPCPPAAAGGPLQNCETNTAPHPAAAVAALPSCRSWRPAAKVRNEHGTTPGRSRRTLPSCRSWRPTAKVRNEILSHPAAAGGPPYRAGAGHCRIPIEEEVTYVP